MAAGSFFFSAAPTVQNSPELHFRFMNSFIQPSRVESLFERKNRDIGSGEYFCRISVFCNHCEGVAGDEVA